MSGTSLYKKLNKTEKLGPCGQNVSVVSLQLAQFTGFLLRGT